MPAAAGYTNVDYGRARIIRIQGTSSYTTGGYDLPNGGAGSSPSAAPLALNDGSTVIGLVASGKVKFLTASTGAEVGNGTDQSANAVKVLVP
jgi:hypothetical protein